MVDIKQVSKNEYHLATILVLSGVEVYLSSFSLGGINVLFTSVSNDSELSFETSPGFDSFKGQKISKGIFYKVTSLKNEHNTGTKN